MGGIDDVERQRLRALIQRAGVAMLMIIDEHGRHMGRPMLPVVQTFHDDAKRGGLHETDEAAPRRRSSPDAPRKPR